MITKTSRLNISNNESIGDSSAVSNCEREPSLSTSSEQSNEEPSAANTCQQNSVILDSNYIESKIKSLLNQEHDNESGPSSPTVEPVDTIETAHVSASVNDKTDRITGILAEDSCNAVDNKISSGESESSQLVEVHPGELSFNGKIRSLNGPSPSSNSQCELTDATKGFEKVRRDKLNESFEILTKENNSLMHYNNEKSPDLFADEDDDDEDGGNNSCQIDAKSENGDVTYSENALVNNSTIVCMNPVEHIERQILKKLQASLSGVLPPPSVTYSRIEIGRMVSLYQQHKDRLCYKEETTVEKATKVEENDAILSPVCLNKPTHPPKELHDLKWPELMNAKAHGIYYNHSTVTEKIELLGLKYVERYIGSETSTSFDTSRAPSSAKKKNLWSKLLNQSPGSRLSHLARRRSTFSSANLLNSSTGSATAGASLSGSQRRLCNRQIIVENKRSDNRRKIKGRTPKRRTPGRRKTPGSSAKKRTLSLPVSKASQQLSREAPKRALFQSPPEETAPKTSQQSPSASRPASSKTQKLKRVLFSPPVKRRLTLASSSCSSKIGATSKNVTSSSDSSGITNISTGESVDLGSGETNRKRKRPLDGEDDDSLVQKQKLLRSDSIKEEDLTPRSLKFPRSQSFCLGSNSKSNKSSTLENSRSGKTLVRANSESVTLTENHRKKLLWAVSQALQTKQISMKHENFRKFASVLAHVVKKLFLEFNDHSVSSTSEKMLRLAHKHLFDVLQGQTAEDIYQRERTRLLNAKNLIKPHGYISPEEYERCKLKRSKSTSVFILDNSNDSSFGAGSSSSQQLVPLSQSSSLFSQSSEFLNGLSQSSAFQNSQSMITGTDSSKNTILRENIDSEQRQKSSQKQISFSGKDQKNVSPYADAKHGSQAKTKLLVGGAAVGTSILKAKRQISFE
ncbi:uncharacterized protein LOC134210627 [Armigeres subalbatus]|uniref:uncharacterized protein LOC134210627 n=1 Tax=Armigeres subalbatus TaxID=124917 RepID=UPI002ED687A4